MKRFVVLLLIFCSCGGKLTDEQRKRLHDGMATQDIRRVSEADLQEAALAYATKIVSGIERSEKSPAKKTKIDSIAAQYQVRIYSLRSDDPAMKEIEKSLLDAYVTGVIDGQAGTNLQKDGTDSLLYTKPIFKNLPDGSQEFSYAIGVKMSRKTIVLSMPAL